jgi:pyridoxal phosphate enzyme (YggS family)
MAIADNIAKIEDRIREACGRSGRKRDEIILMGVSKFHCRDLVEEAWLGGLRYFGESRVQEAVEKFEGFGKNHPGVELHLIGSLQRNKAKTAAAFFDCVQSVDREELILELGKRAAAGGRPLSILFELHTGEESKRGFSSLEDIFRAVELALGFPALSIRGLMTIAPNTGDSGLIRSSFRRLVKARRELERRFPGCPESGAVNAWNWSCLSMGMSGDFEIAVEEGSTLLRIGSAIFGERSR